MIRIALNSSREKEYSLLTHSFREQVAFQTDEMLEILKLATLKEALKLTETEELLDILCMDVTVPQAIPACEQLRKRYPESLLIVIATEDISPVTYLKPTIMAAALLLRPLEDRAVKETAGLLVTMLQDGEKKEENILVIKTQEGKSRIPYSSILYLESRDKKLYVCTATREYGFYSTIEQMERELPEHFLRCHRSYIVNRLRIENVQLSRGLLTLQGDIDIPVSRKYKKAVKEYMT